MSRICLLCGESETPDGHDLICDPCFDNAGEFLERNARLVATASEMLHKLHQYDSDCGTRIQILCDEMNELGLTDESEDARDFDFMDQIGHWEATRRGIAAVMAKAEGRS